MSVRQCVGSRHRTAATVATVPVRGGDRRVAFRSLSEAQPQVPARASGDAAPDEASASMDDLWDGAEATRLQDTLFYLACRQYRIPRQIAEDLVQAAFLTYLEVRDSYPNVDEHPRILVGIFRNKCREHIGRSVRQARSVRALRTALETRMSVSSTSSADVAEKGLLDEMVNREDKFLILEALGELRPKARELFRLIAEEGVSRKELIQRYGLNKNTLDSRLHSFRREFRNLLARRGLEV
jgi:RNA polymerase sigma factor (sigma-70 family)